MPRSQKISSPIEESLTFEDAIRELESIVESMESEQLPLNDIINRYEKASLLLKYCHSELTEVKKRVEQITTKDKDLDLSKIRKSTRKQDNHDISLF